MQGNRYLIPALFFLALGIAWEYSAQAFPSLAFTLPPPSQIAQELWDNHDRFLFHSAITLKEMLLGIAIAFAVSFPLAWIMYLREYARDILQPVFVLVQCTPMFTLAPIMVIWFGWSDLSIIIPTALMIFFPLTTNIYQGLKTTPQELIDYFRVHDATPWQLFTKLQLPWALPHIFSGLRIAAAIAGIGAIAGEWAGAQQGLGLLMLESRRSADIETSFAALFCLTLLGLGLFSFVVLLEKTYLDNKKKSSKTTLAAAALACAGLILCGAQESRQSASTTTIVLDWLPNPNHVPLYAGIKKEIFKKHGVDLAIRKVPDPSTPISYVTSGQVDLAVFYGPNTIRAMHRGAGISLAGVLVEKPLMGLIFRSGEGIEKPKDLSGRVAGYCIDGSSTAYLDTILRKNEIAPAAKRNVSFDLVSTLGAKKVDFIYGAYWNIECEYLRGKEISTGYFTADQLGVPPYPELVIVAKNGTSISLDSFRKALQESIDYSTANPEEAFKMYLESNPDKGEKIAQWEKRAWLTTLPLLARKQSVDQDEWEYFKEWLFANQIIR